MVEMHGTIVGGVHMEIRSMGMGCVQSPVAFAQQSRSGWTGNAMCVAANGKMSNNSAQMV